MSETSARPAINELRSTVDGMAGVDWVTPATRSDLGPLSFREIVPILEKFSKFFELVRSSDLEVLSGSRANALKTSIQQFLQSFNQMRGFDITRNPNPSAARQTIIQDITERYGEVSEQTAILFALSNAKQLSSTDLNEMVEQRVNSAFHAAELDIDKVRTSHIEAENALAAIKEAAGKVGVTAYAKIFSDQANEHKIASRLWLGLTVAMAVATVAWGFVALWYIPVNASATTSQIVQEA